MKTALLLSHAGDVHAEYVEPYLKTKFVVVDPVAMTRGVELSFRFSNGKNHIVYDGKSLDNVGVVWYRKPTPVRYIKLPVSFEHARYSSVSLERHFNLLKASFQDALWVSDTYAIKKADNKNFQCVVASSLGFDVPDTLTTSSAKAAADFVRSHDTVIVKSSSPFPPNRNVPSILPSRLIVAANPDELAGLHLAPSIFQVAIPAKADVRVTVVGEEVFPAIIHDKGVEGYEEVRDWRMAYDGKTAKFELYKLSKDITERCITLVKRLGLQYGAIDFVMDDKDKLWFLEINPNGQWAFIEDDTGYPIGKAIAKLMNKHL
jgi:glutathione synthase/RimK-type ligase-like ATP-grasp enzyme